MNTEARSSMSTILKPVLAAGCVLLTTQALAAPPPWAKGRPHAATQYDMARVVEVDPIIRSVRVEVPSRECWDEVRTVYPERATYASTAGPTIVGGIIGGVLGSQIGSGRGRDVATAAGTLIGASIAHEAAVRRSAPARGPEEYTVERCRTTYGHAYEERIEGYRVTYEYLGREYVTEMPHDPGDRIRVQVAVAPAGY